MKSNKIIAIVGPTGSGKTTFAKKISEKFSGKVISADSRQIYKGLDIGTAKDKSFHQDLVDILTPDQKFSVYDYQQMAEKLIDQYFALKQIPIITGGTGLYLYAVLYGYILPELQSESKKLREQLEKLSENELYKKLKELDEKSSRVIDPKNKRRLIRALEVSILTEKPFSELQKKLKPKYDILIIGIKSDRDTLYAKIDARVDKMIKDGLVEEVRSLLKKYRKDSIAFNTIGYKEIIDYIDGKMTLSQAIEKIKNNTHAYVRRQDTWFKRNKDIKWVENYEEAEKLVNKFIKKQGS